MLSADIKSKIDKLWNTFWSEGISNPLTVIEQAIHINQFSGFVNQVDKLKFAWKKCRITLIH